MNVQRAFVRPLLIIAPMLVVVGLAGGTVAAKDGDVKASGACGKGSTWTLKAGPRDSGIETEFEVDSNKVGQVWKVRLTDNGVRVFAGTRTTTVPSGSFSIERRIANRAGTDRIVGTATNVATGETCSGSVSL